MAVHTRTATSSVLCFHALHFNAPTISFLLFPALACLFAHFCFGRMRVADGVSIDLSKWDNSHGSATNRTKTLVARANAAWQAHSKTNSGESCASSSCPSLKQHVLPIYFPSILFLTRVHAKRFKATTCAHAPPPSRRPDHLHPRSHLCWPCCRDPHLWMRRQRAASQTSPASSRSGWA